MRITIYLTTLFLPWLAYDQNLFRHGRHRSAFYYSYATNTDQEKKQREQKEIKQHHGSVIPPWLKKPKPKLRMKCNHFSVKSRDVRDSNQRMIRRRFNNM